MTYLNCSIGDLAITVRAHNPENIGRIVRIVGSHGVLWWHGFSGGTHIWQVEVASAGTFLVYEADGSKRYATSGMCPDAFLRRLVSIEQTEVREEECYA